MTPRERLLRMRSMRRVEEEIEDDPAAGLVNLFDLWMVFALAVLLTMVGAVREARLDRTETNRAVGQQLEASGRSSEGEGQRIGIAYRLSNGRVVYVPERQVTGKPASPPR